MRARHPAIVRGVKPRLTMRRSSVWPGGSIATSMPPRRLAGQALLAHARRLAEQHAAHGVGAEQVGVGQRPGHVVVAGQHEGVGDRAAVHRRLVAEPPVRRVRVGAPSGRTGRTRSPHLLQ